MDAGSGLSTVISTMLVDVRADEKSVCVVRGNWNTRACTATAIAIVPRGARRGASGTEGNGTIGALGRADTALTPSRVDAVVMGRVVMGFQLTVLSIGEL